VRTPSGLFGMLVDDLVSVFEIDASQREPVRPPIERWAQFIKSIIKTEGGPLSSMVLELDPKRLIDVILTRGRISA
jgi:chemotaxis signal transduction protein